MKNQYSFWADLLNKFHTLEPFVQVAAIFAFTAIILGSMFFIKEMATKS